MSSGTLKPLTLLVIAALCVCGVAALASSEDADGATTSTLTFNANYPDGTSSTAQSWSMVVGATIQLPTQLFECDGYVLTGWGRTASGSATYDAGDSYTVTSSNVTLYAKWTEVPTQTYFYFADDATSTASVDSVYSFSAMLDSGTDAWAFLAEFCSGYPDRILKSDNTPDWLSMTYTFVSGSGYRLTFSGSPDKPGNYIVEYYVEGWEDTGVYWVINVPANTDTTYTITYDIDGGSGGTPSSVLNARYGQAIVLNNGFVNGTEITKSGQSLVGWYAPNELGVEGTYALGSVFGVYGSITLTAHWESAPNVIIFSMDGGSLENVDAYIVYEDEWFSLPTESDATKDGYTLIGWRVTGDDQAAYAPGFLLELDGEPVKLEAYFAETSSLPSLCLVTYDYGDGYGTFSTQYVESGMYVYLPNYGWSDDGLTFVGWSEDPDGGVDDVINTYTYRITGSTTLYAVWTDDSDTGGDSGDGDPDIYTVTFNPNGATTSVAQQQVYEGGLVSQPTGMMRDGMILVGWYSSTKGGLWDFDTDTVQGNMLLTAQWEQHFSYTVDGLTVTVTIYTGSQSGRDYAQNATVSWGDGTSESTVSGSAVHTYAGVNSASRITVTSTIGGVEYTSYLPLSGLDGDHVPETVTCTVTFDTNGGDTSSWTVEVERFSTVTEPSDPVRGGYTFTGWYWYGNLWDFSTQVTQDMTLVAGWIDDETGEVIDPTDPDLPAVVYPTAVGSITATADGGWTLSATASLNAVSYVWRVDGEVVGTSAVCTVYDLGEGEHPVTLTVTSTTGHTATWTGSITVEPEDEERSLWDRFVAWVGDNVYLVCGILVAVIVLIMVARLYL